MALGGTNGGRNDHLAQCAAPMLSSSCRATLESEFNASSGGDARSRSLAWSARQRELHATRPALHCPAPCCTPRCVGSAGAGEFVADTYVPAHGSCHFHFYGAAEALECIAERKSLLVFGDSTTRGLVLALLQLLDPSHTDPFDVYRWFNASRLPIDSIEEGVKVGFLAATFTRAGTVVFKTAKSRGNSSVLDTKDVLASLEETPDAPPGGAALTYVMVTQVDHMLNMTRAVLSSERGRRAAGRVYVSAGIWNLACHAGQRTCPTAGNRPASKEEQRAALAAQIAAATAELPRICAAAAAECHVGTLISSPKFRAEAHAANLLIKQGVAAANERTVAEGAAGARAALGLVDNEPIVSLKKHGSMGVHQNMLMNTWLYQQLLSLFCPDPPKQRQLECTEVLRFGRACRSKREQGEGWTAAWRRRCDFRVQYKGHEPLLQPGPQEGRCSCDATGGSALAPGLGSGQRHPKRSRQRAQPGTDSSEDDGANRGERAVPGSNREGERSDDGGEGASLSSIGEG